MEVRSGRQRWTYSEFARVRSEGSERYEVLDGELVMTPAPTSNHQRVVMRLGSRLHVFAERHGLGTVLSSPIDVLFAEGDYFEPDIVFVRREREAILSDRGLEGPPDLAVEVLSPSTAERDLGVKLERYELFGVPTYWVVDPVERRVLVWDFAAGASAAELVEAGERLVWEPSEGVTLDIDPQEILG